MKKTFALLTAIIGLSTFTNCQATLQEGFYVGGLGSSNIIYEKSHSNYNTGYAVGGFAGYEWCNGLRLEVESTYRHNSHHENRNSRINIHRHSHLHAWSGMVNAIYDMQLCLPNCSPCWMSKLHPYVGAGIGYTHQRFQKQTREGFAWQLITGLSYELTPDTDIALDYRAHKGNSHHIYANSLGATVRYHF